MGFKLISQTDEGLKALMKIHKGLIRKVLKDNDVIKHILYSPIGPLKRAPFGVQGRLASYALVTTGARFIISQNFHNKKILPQVYEIDFNDIVSIELGKALLIGWLRIKFKREDRVEEISVDFGATSGILEHFRRVVKIYLEAQKVEPRGFLSRKVIIRDMSVWQKEQLAVLFNNGLIVLSHINKPSFQIKKTYLVEENILLTEYGMIVISNNSHSFLSGTNIMCIPYRSITDLGVEEIKIENEDLLGLRLGCQRQILFKSEQKDELLDFIEGFSTMIFNRTKIWKTVC